MTTRQAVVIEARTWLRTPYHHCADVRGAGVDCAMLLVRVYQACGLTPLDFDPRPYSPQWHLHRGEELYLQWLQVANAVLTTTPQAGDVAIWRFGRAYSHARALAILCCHIRGPRLKMDYDAAPGLALGGGRVAEIGKRACCKPSSENATLQGVSGPRHDRQGAAF